MKSEEEYNDLFRKLTPEEQKKSEEAYAKEKEFFNLFVDQCLNDDAKAILKEKWDDGFACYALGLAAPIILGDDFIQKHPLQVTKETEKVFYNISNAMAKDTTVTFISEHYDLAVSFFALSAYKTCVETGKTKKVS